MVRKLSDQMVAQRCQILYVFLSIFSVLGGRSVNCWSFSGPGDARWGFGLPGLDFGAQHRANPCFGGTILGWLLDTFGVCFLRCFFGRPLDHVFDDFGMIRGSIVGSFSSHV